MASVPMCAMDAAVPVFVIVQWRIRELEVISVAVPKMYQPDMVPGWYCRVDPVAYDGVSVLDCSLWDLSDWADFWW
jgi:hypothetical protein